MDSLQGIPVEYKLDAFNMPRTGTTLCHPKIGYVNAMPLFRKRHLALNSPLGYFNGDQRTPSPQVTRHTKLLGDSKVQSLTRPTTHAAISTFSNSHNSISSQYSQPFTSLAAPKANPIFYAANKNLFKNIFRPSPSYFFIILPLFTLKLSEGTNNTKRGNNST